jgi:O-antigen ligase
MLALVATACVMLATVGIRRRHLGAIAICGVGLLLVLPKEVEERLMTVKSIAGADKGGRLDSSVEKRRILLGSGLGMFNDHPLTGVGAGNFSTYYAKYAARIGMSGIDYGIRGEHEFPHNLYLEIASETGLIGLASYGAIALSILLSLWNARQLLRRRGDAPHAVLASCVGAAIAGYLVASLFLHESHIRYFGLYVGFGIAVTRLAREHPSLPVLAEEAA